MALICSFPVRENSPIIIMAMAVKYFPCAVQGLDCARKIERENPCHKELETVTKTQ